MNIETLTVEYIRTGRLLADVVLPDDALAERLPENVLSCIEKLHARTCLPRDAEAVAEPLRNAIEAERVAVQMRLDALKELGRIHDTADRRLVVLRMTNEMCGRFEAATHELLAHTSHS
ncbi:hypothetical protein SAMN05421853_1422 [Roseivivax halotolerans]|uniref:Uncharacterized protein n=1 Tax=Roseivivax halotolerans TaxID=93684 RepID=A0A1I6ARL8_9RHOB|nr:hypothetical protein [Roseivivax halotolerans]SFQ71256.1 hypothetical protein SAMN05421853_1422 [Roseivivax halotolerans]